MDDKKENNLWLLFAYETSLLTFDVRRLRETELQLFSTNHRFYIRRIVKRIVMYNLCTRNIFFSNKSILDCIALMRFQSHLYVKNNIDFNNFQNKLLLLNQNLKTSFAHLVNFIILYQQSSTSLHLVPTPKKNSVFVCIHITKHEMYFIYTPPDTL